MGVGVVAKATTYYFMKGGQVLMSNLSKKSNFIHRKDPTRRVRIAAEKAERAQALGIDDLQMASGGGGQQADLRLKPKYCCGYSPARAR